MSREHQEGENLAPQVRSEVTTGAARLGAALLNTSTDPLTQIPDHTGGLASLAEPEASSRLSLHYTGTEQPQRDAAADDADGRSQRCGLARSSMMAALMNRLVGFSTLGCLALASPQP